MAEWDGKPERNMPPRMGALQPGRLLHGLGYRREDTDKTDNTPEPSELRSDGQAGRLIPTGELRGLAGIMVYSTQIRTFESVLAS